jgi:tetratricopeptide (TPR) repeat protein
VIRQLFNYLQFLLLLCVLCSGLSAHAQKLSLQPCPEAFAPIASADPQERRRELGRLQNLSESCLKRADFYAYQGQLLLLQERFADALVALERALLLDESRPGVQLDYVLALSSTGDAESARALAQQVLERDDAPPAVRDALKAVLRDNREATLSHQTGDGQSQTWQWRGSVQSMLGTDQNLNSATSADAINLTLPNGNVSLLLDETSKPRAGVASLLAGQLVGQAGIDQGVLVVQGDWRQRLVPAGSEYGYSQQDASVLLRPYSGEGWVQRVAVSSFSMGGASLFTGLAMATWKEQGAEAIHHGLSNCTYRAGVEAERRTYAQDTTQNGFYGSLMGALLCAAGDNQYQLGIQTGRDWATYATRAGGDQTRVDLKALWARQWSWGRTTAEWIASDLRDSGAYSALLGGSTRKTLRQNARISVTKRLNSQEKPNLWGGLYWVSAYEVLRHSSNLELFDVHGESLYTGLRYEF